ncbi:glycosyltransferase [Cryptosporangium sp. NPDC048952]|uniref:glycosyltransferase n=1 Tax=Cryptosporangium sp. NPDC048952 TaxID=3363961 RepID=UPI00371CF73C
MGDTVLYLLNVSNPDRLSADSGWLFADILAPALVDLGTRVTIGCPVPVSDPRVEHVPMPVVSSKYRVRFTADVAALAALIEHVEPSVVVANQVEHAGAIRAAVLEASSRARVVGYCHYLPFHVDEQGLQPDAAFVDGGLGLAVRMQFFTGLAACDRIMVHSPTAATWVAAGMAVLGVDDLAERIRVVPPPRDPRLVADGPRTPPPLTAGRTVQILYNHRLYEHYGTGRFLELASQLTANPAVRLTVMDLFGDRAGGRRSLDASPERHRAALAEMPGVQVVSDGGDRAFYRELLAGADLALAPFRAGCTWSMSLIDCQAMGVPVLAPRLGWLAGAVEEGLAFDEPHEAVKIAEGLLADPAAWTAASARAAETTRALAPELVAARYLAAFA